MLFKQRIPFMKMGHMRRGQWAGEIAVSKGLPASTQGPEFKPPEVMVLQS